jgi:ABC-type lipoprotein export system ATPase subunit
MLRGPSGGGKTTLLNILGTIDKATSGYVGKQDGFNILITRRSFWYQN